jgi:HSP20 family protein
MIRRSYLNELERLQREMDRLFDVSLPVGRRARTRAFPAINIWTNEDAGIFVTAELPGVPSDAIDISVTADLLEISGACQPQEEPESGTYHRQERIYCDFNRKVQLPYTVDPDKVEATVQNGVLRITLPRAEAEKPKRIAVSSSS